MSKRTSNLWTETHSAVSRNLRRNKKATYTEEQLRLQVVRKRLDELENEAELARMGLEVWDEDN